VNEFGFVRRLGLLAFLFVVSPLVLAEDGEDLRIAFVNAARIVEIAPQAAEARKRLEDEFAPRDSDLVQMQEEIREAEDELARQTRATDSERRGMEREILTQKRELKRAQEEFREDLNIRRNEEFARLQRLVADVITTMAREEGFDLIVNEAAVIYASDRVDVTEMVLERLKSER
jgi:outer membrane protein